MTAFQADLPVDTKHGSTTGTAPPPGFKSEKGLHSLVPDHQQIFNETGTVFRTVPEIELLYPAAGKYGTFVAET